jgi:hypothetical protein
MLLLAHGDAEPLRVLDEEPALDQTVADLALQRHLTEARLVRVARREQAVRRPEVCGAHALAAELDGAGHLPATLDFGRRSELHDEDDADGDDGGGAEELAESVHVGSPKARAAAGARDGGIARSGPGGAGAVEMQSRPPQTLRRAPP